MPSTPSRGAAIAIVLVVAVAGGCKKTERGGARATCDDVGRQVTKTMAAGVPAEQRAGAHAGVDLAFTIASRRCRDDQWSADAIRCVSLAKSKNECKGKLTPEQLERLMDAFAALAAAATESCAGYVVAVEAFVGCGKAPQDARDAARQELDTMAQGWSELPPMPEELSKGIDDDCKDALDRLTQSASTMGCEL